MGRLLACFCAGLVSCQEERISVEMGPSISGGAAVRRTTGGQRRREAWVADDDRGYDDDGDIHEVLYHLRDISIMIGNLD
jgi:hypothetical protein|eukprot:COSAG01_NODE_457_length_16751_cov_34.906918_2_plen_80_part_00